MQGKDARIAIRLDQVLYESLQKIAQSDGTTISRIIRGLLTDYVNLRGTWGNEIADSLENWLTNHVLADAINQAIESSFSAAKQHEDLAVKLRKNAAEMRRQLLLAPIAKKRSSLEKERAKEMSTKDNETYNE